MTEPTFSPIAHAWLHEGMKAPCNCPHAEAAAYDRRRRGERRLYALGRPLRAIRRAIVWIIGGPK